MVVPEGLGGLLAVEVGGGLVVSWTVGMGVPEGLGGLLAAVEEEEVVKMSTCLGNEVPEELIFLGEIIMS